MKQDECAFFSEELVAKATAFLEKACDQDRRLVTAESCTAGLLAALLTEIRGRSHAFDRGIVSYSEDAKRKLLGVSAEDIDRYGAVSRQVALAMARGALGDLDNAIAVSITGFAGPAGKDDEEGLVHLACIGSDGHCEHREEHFGAIGRDGVRVAALAVALEMFENALSA